MKQSEQLVILRGQASNCRSALSCVVRGMVQWTEKKFVARVSGMPKTMIRLGLTESSAPLVIIHDFDTLDVLVVTPDQVAHWSWPAVDAFPGLGAFLSKHASETFEPLDSPMDSWRNRKG